MIFIALGANLPSRYGEPPETFEAAKHALNEKGMHVLQSSRIWMTAPVPISDQPWYHNAVLRVETSLSPYQVLETMQHIEADFGRERIIRNASRTLDLDLLAYEDVILDRPELIVPHPRMHERAFVLMPLSEVAPDDWVHPTKKQTLKDLRDALSLEQEAVPLEQKNDHVSNS